MSLRLNVGAGPHYAKGWVNVDVVSKPDAGIAPDLVASITDLPCETSSVRRLYAGHCLEHLSLQDNAYSTTRVPGSTFDQAMREVARVLEPQGAAAFVCPDLYRALAWWKDGRAGWELVDACLEGPDGGIDPGAAWDGCFHAWNCNEARLLALVRRTFPEAAAVPLDSPLLDEFPVVSRAAWQCAVVTRR